MNLAPFFAATAAAIVIGTVSLSSSLKTDSAAAPAPSDNDRPNMVAEVQLHPGLCAVTVSAGLRRSGDKAKAEAIDGACAAVQTHDETGRWPTGYAP